jgi:hypothetical protein
MLALAVTAKTFGERPSALLGIADRMLALELDLAAAATLARAQSEALEGSGTSRDIWT